MGNPDIGIGKNIVKLNAHNEKWRLIFEETQKELRGILHDFDIKIEHIGSTSIPGIVAKPIIDMAIGIQEDIMFLPIMKLLIDNGYIYRGDSGDKGGHLFVKEIAEKVRTHHIHVVNLEDVQWENYIFLRDTLRLDSSLRNEYQNLKRDLSIKFKHDRRSYTDGKNKFIRRILERR